MGIQRLALYGLALLSALPATAQERCGGKPILVSKPETARAIFLAVERDYAPHADRKRHALVSVEDMGDAWRVGRSAPLPKPGRGTVPVRGGGGQLGMRIAKCDGALSDAYFAR